MDAFAFLQSPRITKPRPVYVLAGEEAFLRREARRKIQVDVLGESADEMARSAYEGSEVEFAAVRDELYMAPFLSSRRLVVIQEADPFVTRHREALERYLEKPSGVGTLLLEVKTWRSNTRLAKIIPTDATISCEPPKQQQLPEWCRKRAAQAYGKNLAAAAARLLVDLVGPEMGVLDQELAKLACYVGEAETIQPDDVDRLVGHSRTETAWQMLDAVAEGDRGKALRTLHHLFDQGEDPMAVLGAMSWQLRRLAQAARLGRQGMSLASALARLGVPPFAQRRMEQQLRLLGPRANLLYDWLLEADLGLKSSGGLPPRMIVERLLVQVAQGRGQP